MQFWCCIGTILGVLWSRRVVKIVLLKRKYEKRLAAIGAMETGIEKIDSRQTLQLQIHIEAENRWSFSLLILMLDNQRRFHTLRDD